MKLHKAFLLGTIISLGLAALIGIVALLGGTGRTTEMILLSVLSFGYFSLASLICALSIERQRLIWLAWTGLVWSWVSFVFALLMIWADPWLHEVIPWRNEEQMCATGFYMSFFASHVCLLWLASRVEKWSKRVRWAATISAIGLACMFLDVVFEVTPLVDWDDDLYARVAGAVAIVTASTSIVFPILLRFDRVRRQETTTTTDLEMRIHCPRCGMDQVITSGRSRCQRCRLRFNLEIEEPTCEKCGYVLYKPSGAACPECGHPIAEDDRWVGVDADSSNESHDKTKAAATIESAGE